VGSDLPSQRLCLGRLRPEFSCTNHSTKANENRLSKWKGDASLSPNPVSVSSLSTTLPALPCVVIVERIAGCRIKLSSPWISRRVRLPVCSRPPLDFNSSSTRLKDGGWYLARVDAISKDAFVADSEGCQRRADPMALLLVIWLTSRKYRK
jgi:hypothetical protein